MPPEFYTKKACRICGSKSLYKFLDLGQVPPVNDFKPSPNDVSSHYPLEVVVCEDCYHVQLKHTVRRDLLFADYAYFSSSSSPIVEHFAAYATELESTYLSNDDLVVEIGCNDGVMLHQFSDTLRRVGVEPAENTAEVAQKEHGLDVVTDFFNVTVAEQICTDYGEASAIVANNVLGHIDDLHEVLMGIDTLLSDDGVFVIEVPYLVDLLNNIEFDTIYHEHISYFALRPLAKLVEQFDMELFDVERQDVHGGTIRAFVQKSTGTHERSKYVDDLFALEAAIGLSEQSTYDAFQREVQSRRKELVDILDSLQARDATIVGYGASAKGNVLLNYCNIGPETIDFIVDTTPAKQGKYTPGTNIPVRPDSDFSDPYPDVALLLAWNFKDAILENETKFRDSNGRFFLPAPHADII